MISEKERIEALIRLSEEDKELLELDKEQKNRTDRETLRVLFFLLIFVTVYCFICR